MAVTVTETEVDEFADAEKTGNVTSGEEKARERDEEGDEVSGNLRGISLAKGVEEVAVMVKEKLDPSTTCCGKRGKKEPPPSGAVIRQETGLSSVLSGITLIEPGETK